jgi:hypothetical protein
MEMTVTTTITNGVLYANFTGVFSLADAKESFTIMLQEVVRNKIAKVLFDGRLVTGAPTTIERLLYAEFAATEVREQCHSIRLFPSFAYLMLPPLRDPGRFGENVAVNRGMNMETFEKMEDAVEWLDKQAVSS